MMLAMFSLLIALASCSFFGHSVCYECNRKLGKKDLLTLSKLSEPARLRPDGELLNPILKKRVSGTKNNTSVREFIISQLQTLHWHIEIDGFEAITPKGKVKFNNIIATKNFYAPRKLIFAAHYDSKYFKPPDDNFVAATDSAVPCAMLLDLAISLDPLLDRQKDDGISLQLVFFDGEEAFEAWNDQDSVYGARHLAKRWKQESAIHRFDHFSIYQSRLNSIELFVLLDLLGSENTPLVSLKENTNHFYQKLVNLETKIFNYQLNPPTLNQRQILDLAYFAAQIDDDHRPFEQLGVSILHLIPISFPKFWHTLGDDASVISERVVNHLTLLFRAFIVEYLCLAT